MGSVGETLRRERLRAGLDLHQIAKETKISARTLELIESDQFDKLPGGVFTRSFVRQYARAVGLDEDEITRELEQVLAPGAPPLPTATEIERREIRVPRMTWASPGGFSENSSLPALVLVVAVIIACSGAYSLWQKTRRAPAPPPQTSAQVPAPPAQAPQAERTVEATATPGQPEPAQPASSATPTAVETSAPGALHLALTAAEPTWVQARANGKVVFSGIIQANETKSLEAADTVTLRVGNAGGISISLNGKSIPQLGPKGQVRVVQLSPDGAVQVEAPKPQAPPTAPQAETL